MLKKVLAAALVVLFSSCIEGKIDISVNGDLSGSVEADLLVAGESMYVSSDLSSLNYQYIPITEDSIKSIINKNRGLELVSYSSSSSGGDVAVKYRIDAEDISSVNLLSGYEDGIKTLSITFPGKGRVRIILKNPVPDKMSAETRSLISSLYKDRTITLTVKVAGFITNTDIGQLGEDPSSALLKVNTVDMVSSREDTVWNIEYTPENGG